MPASLEVATEREGNACWIFQIRRGGESTNQCEMTLAWADYDWWSPTGRHTPSEVALAVMGVIAATQADGGAAIGATDRFDASTIRRRIPGADALIIARLARRP